MDITETEALFGILEKYGVDYVEISYDGSSDSGEVYAIDLQGKVECIKTINLNSEIDMKVFAKVGVKFSKDLVMDCIENISMNMVDEKESGWKNDDGSMGQVRWFPKDKKISIFHQERVIDFNDREHEISV